jgi:hypothetical protein
MAETLGNTRMWAWLPLTLGLNWLDASSAYTLSPSKRGEGNFFVFLAI